MEAQSNRKFIAGRRTVGRPTTRLDPQRSRRNCRHQHGKNPTQSKLAIESVGTAKEPRRTGSCPSIHQVCSVPHRMQRDDLCFSKSKISRLDCSHHRLGMKKIGDKRSIDAGPSVRKRRPNWLRKGPTSSWNWAVWSEKSPISRGRVRVAKPKRIQTNNATVTCSP